MNHVQPTAQMAPTVLGTCCVPWRNHGDLDEDLFRSSIRNLHNRGMHDLYIFGTAGEGHAVCDTRFREVTSVFVEELHALDADPMVGVISLSLPTMLERLNFVHSIGVRSVQISLPNWGPIRDSEVRAFFRETCDSFPDLKFMHYNLSRSGRLLRPDEYSELADRHPNLVATKYGAGEPETVAGLMRGTPQLTHFFTELGYYQGAPLGPCGLLSSISSSNPLRARKYFEAGREKDWPTLTTLYRELAGIMVGIRDCIGRGLMDGAYDKAIAKVAEPNFPLYLLPPYEGASEDAFLKYFSLLTTLFPSWLPEKLD